MGIGSCRRSSRRNGGKSREDINCVNRSAVGYAKTTISTRLGTDPDLHATADAAGGLRPDVTISGRQAQLAGQVLRVVMRSGSGTLVETWNQEVTDTTAEIPGVTDSAR